MKKRIMAAALAATTAFSLAACGGGNETGTKSDLPKGEAKYPIQTEAKLTYWCNLPNQVSSVVSNYGDTPFAKNLAEATGIQVEYMHPAQGQDNALNLLIASGDMPDIVQAYWTQQNPKSCIDQKIILSLNDYINDYSPNFKKYTEDNPEIAKSLTTDDGDYYVYPFMREDTSLCSTAGFMLRADWLEEAGLEVPETIEEWDAVLAAFKEKCEAPFAMNRYDFFAGGFNAFPDMYVDNGTVKYGAIEENYKNLVVKLNEWYEKGYIDKNYAIADSKLMDSNILNGVSGITHGAGGGKMGTYLASNTTEEGFDLVAAKYPSAKKGEKPNYAGTEWQYTTMGAAISASSKNPELAARYLDFGYSEEGMMFYNFGKEGESYDMIDGYPTYKPELVDTTDGTPIAQKLVMNCLGAESGPFVQKKQYIEQYYATDRQRDAINQWADNNWYNHKMPSIMLTAEESTEYGSIMTEIGTYVNETFNNMIIGKVSVDEFESYVEKVKSMGLDRAIKIQQDAYDRYMNR